MTSEEPAGRIRGSLPWTLALVLFAGLVSLTPALRGQSVVDQPEVLDIGNQWINFAYFVRTCYEQGHFPLWDPHDMCGTPFLAFAHTASLYPPWLLLHLVFPLYHYAQSINIFLHLSLASLAMFGLARECRISRPAAFLAAFAYAFSGYIFGNINFPPSLHTGAWLAAFYASSFSLLNKPRASNLVLAALCFSAMILGGDLEMVIYALLGFGFEIIVRRFERRITWPELLSFAGAIAAGGLVAAAQVLPALELQGLSVRSGESFMPDLSPLSFLVLPVYALFPVPVPAEKFPPNLQLSPFYLGALLLLFVIASLREPGARKRLLIFPLAAVYIVLFYVPPLNQLFSRVPVLGGILVPFRIWPVLTIFFLIAAAQGMDAWLENPARKASAATPFLFPGGRAGAWFLIGFGLLSAVLLYWSSQGLILRAVFIGALIGAGLGALFPGSTFSGWLLRRRVAVYVLLALLDLGGLVLGHLPRTDPARFQIDPLLESRLGDSSGRLRYQILSIRGIIDRGLPYHLGLRLNADTIDSFSRVPPRSAAKRLSRLYPSLLKYRNGRLVRYDQMAIRDPKNLAPAAVRLFNEMNVTLFISRHRVNQIGPGVEIRPLPAAAGYFIYQNRTAKPRARLRTGDREAPAPVSYPAPDRVLVTLPTLSFNGPASGPAGTLTLADSWYPGWKAEQSGRELRISSDEFGFRKLQVKNRTPVEMHYQPISFQLGLWSSLTAFSGLGLCLILRIRQSRVGSGN